MAVNRPDPKVIFFDLDSTLIVQTENSLASWTEACRRHENRITSIPLASVVDSIHQYAGGYWNDPQRHKTGRLDLRKARRQIAISAFDGLGLHDQELAERIADEFSDRRELALTLMPEALEVLTCLRNEGIQLGLITNGESKGQRAKIRRFELASFFDYIQIEEEAGIGKPEDGVYEMALQKLGVTPEETWMVGDDLVWDIEASQKAGLWAVWIDMESKGLPQNSAIIPNWIIHSLKELIPA